jgi:hypothetical protein
MIAMTTSNSMSVKAQRTCKPWRRGRNAKLGDTDAFMDSGNSGSGTVVGGQPTRVGDLIVLYLKAGAVGIRNQQGSPG